MRLWFVLQGMSVSTDCSVSGPPGTGKTRTISVALEEWARCGEPAWVIAQSNVGVKNIARTLIKHDVDFKLIVSKEFYVEWSVFVRDLHGIDVALNLPL